MGIVGGAVMCLVFNARQATKDIDAVFEPTEIIRKLVAQIAEEKSVSVDWLNDAVKGYLKNNFKREEIFKFSNLKIWAPEASYMLAMKCISARFDTNDKDDVIFLIDHLKLKTPEAVYRIIEKYYPKNQITAKTRFLIEAVFDRD